MKFIAFLLLPSLMTFDAQALAEYYAENPIVFEPTSEQRDVAADMLWDQLLQQYVDRDGKVNYRGIKADPKFKTCVQAYSAIKVKSDWSRDQKMAYWINAYNLFTVKLIVDNYPLKSITDLKEPWKQKFITLDGTKYSLNQIENEIIRPTFKDARIHFAINCASISCPKLNNRAFFPQSLDKVLDTLTRQFLSDSSQNKITPESVELSKIFEWYAEDFTSNGSTVIAFLNRFGMGVKPDASVTYLTYNWGLNSK
jgi:hypothetical protein